MLRRNERPLPPTIAEVCVACSKQRQVKAAMRTLGDMLDIGVEPSEAVIKHFMRAASTELELGLPDQKMREDRDRRLFSAALRPAPTAARPHLVRGL